MNVLLAPKFIKFFYLQARMLTQQNFWAFHLFLSRIDVVLVPSVTSQRVCFKECTFQHASQSPEFTVSLETQK